MFICAYSVDMIEGLVLMYCMLSGDLLICASSHLRFCLVTMVTSLENIRRLHFCYIAEL